MPAPSDPTRWPEVKRLFEEAVDLAPSARAAFLDAACRTAAGAPDPDLRAAVESLLTADALADSQATTGGFLAAPTFALGGLLDGLGVDLADAPAQTPAGTRVGPYRIVSLLGRGGMGEVYLAERADGLFERTVALKRVRTDLSPSVAARFSTERQILANLVHPGIARLYAAGTDADGRPWLAMEPVDGVPLPDYAQALPEAGRIGLLLQVCAAVQHAHQHLVVHRDLKPSNVLVVDADGEPRAQLLDFGIAQILGGEADGHRFLTRAYAAPEQLRGDDPTTASDLYGLGALLVETLTGRRPEAPGQAPGLDGDLGAIARAALAAEPADRYASAAALADDLRRYLGGLPVTACPPTLGYRARRFVGRHRLTVGVAALALALVVAAGTAAALRVTAERDLARQAAADAEAVAETQGELLRVLEPSFLAELDTSSTAGRPTLGAVVADVIRTVEVRYADRPAVLAGTLAALGTTLFERGDLRRADALFERAVSLRRPLRRDGDRVVHHALVGRGLTARMRGDREAARAFFREALAMERAHPEVIRSDEESDTEVYLAGVIGDADARETALYRTLAERRAAFPAVSVEVALAHNELGVHHFNTGDFRGAFAEYSAAERIVHRLFGELHPNTVVLRTNLAYAAAEMGRPVDAERHARIALDAARRGEHGPLREASLQQALGQALFFQDRLPESEHELRRALATFEREAGKASAGILMVQQSLVVVLSESGRLGEALAVARKIEAASRAAGALGEPDGIFARAQVAALRFALGEREAGLAQLRATMPDLRTVREPWPMRFVVLEWVGDALRESGDAAAAEPLLREALALARESKPDAHWNVRRLRFDYGRALAALGRSEEARPHLEAVRGHIRRAAFPSVVPDPDAEIDRLLASR